MENKTYLEIQRTFSYLQSAFINPSKAMIAPIKKISVFLKEMGEKGTTRTVYDIDTDIYSIKVDSSALADALGNINKKSDSFQISMLYILAMYYHQMAHISFSSFNTHDNQKLHKILSNETDRNYALDLFHILEDMFIESQLIYIYSRSRYYLNAMNKGIAKARTSVYKDEATFNSVYNYLAVFLREGPLTEITNEFIDVNEAECFKYMDKFYAELNSEKRFDIALDFYIYLKTKLPKPEKRDHEEQDGPSAIGKKGLPMKSKNSSSGKGKSEAGIKLAKGRLKPGEDEIDGDPDDLYGETGDYLNYFKDKSALPNYDKFSDQIIETTCTHEFVDVSSVFEIRDINKMQAFTDKLIVKNSDLINEVMQIIDEFRTVNFIYQIPGFNSGNFSMSTYVKDEPLLKCFTRASGFSFEKDLVFYLLVDNSGSMNGLSAQISTEAMIVLYECLARLEIPFEYSMFTANGDGNYAETWTYVIKDINMDPSLGYKYLPISYDHGMSNEEFKKLIPSYMLFHGNQEDNNIYYIHRRMQEWARRNKILIVLCDGGTCGDGGYARLRKTVAEATAEGMLVLGIGILNDVSHLYKNFKNFNSYEDLRKNFAPFLTDFLIKNITE